MAWWDAGHDAAYQAARHELRQAQWEADRLWLLAFGEKESRAYLLERLDKVGELIAQHPTASDDFLAEVIAAYFQALDNVREPIGRGDETGVTPPLRTDSDIQETKRKEVA